MLTLSYVGKGLFDDCHNYMIFKINHCLTGLKLIDVNMTKSFPSSHLVFSAKQVRTLCLYIHTIINVNTNTGTKNVNRIIMHRGKKFLKIKALLK